MAAWGVGDAGEALGAGARAGAVEVAIRREGHAPRGPGSPARAGGDAGWSEGETSPASSQRLIPRSSNTPGYGMIYV